MAALFISDLHLSESSPHITEGFSQFLTEKAAHASQLFILGDLFEVWLGDDDFTPLNARIISELRQLSDSGVQLFIQHGNRDFMIGKHFAEATGARLIDDPTVIELYGTELVLMHGDSLCTDDIKYQKAKKRIRNPIVLPILKRLPLSTRTKIAGNLRNKSAQDKQMTKMEIMDANAVAVERAFDDYDVKTMIHGHTHRPAKHDHHGRTRWVLGDWGQFLWYAVLDENGVSLHQEPIQA